MLGHLQRIMGQRKNNFKNLMSLSITKMSSMLNYCITECLMNSNCVLVR
jgi:hypothetical protein